MAKFQWTAASETLGQPPANLTNVCEGSLANWEIVAAAGASGGQAVQCTGGSGLRRRLALAGDNGTGRIDVRGRFYKSTTAGVSLHCAIRNKGTDASDTYDYLLVCNGSGAFGIYKYAPSYTSVAVDPDTVPSGSRIGWWNFRYTFDPSGTPVHDVKVWSDAGSEASPEYTFSGSTTDANVNGTRVCIGAPTTTEAGGLYDWITVGTGADDADASPSSGGATHALAGDALVSVAASADLTTAAATPVKGVSLTLYDGSTAQASVTGITAVWWDTTDPSAFAAPAYSTSTASTDVSGLFTLDLDAATALSIGQSGFLLLYKAGATATDDLIFAGRLAVQDIG